MGGIRTLWRGLAVSVALAGLSSPLALSRPALALPGGLDSGFATGGLIIDGTPPGSHETVATQPDGKLVVAGLTPDGDGGLDLQVIRYTSTGGRDLSFGSGGRTVTDLGEDEQATALALQPDGKILVGVLRSRDWNNPTENQGVVVRYGPTGSLDTTFGSGGSALVGTGTRQNRIRSLMVLPDGDMLVAGFSTVSYVQRLRPDGTVDDSFTNVPPTILGPPVVAMPVPMRLAAAGVLSDGRIVVAGTAIYPDTTGDALTVRLTAAGALDQTFGDGGTARVRLGTGGAVHDMAVQADGKVVLVGGSTPALVARLFAVARLTAAGRPDLSFGLGGQVLAAVADAQSARATSMQLAPDGTIFVSGWASSPAPDFHHRLIPSRQFVAHLGRTGALDLRFGNGGIATTVVGGEPQAQIHDLTVQSDGAPVAVGRSLEPGTLLERGFMFRLQPAAEGGPIVGWGFNQWGQVGNVLGTVLQATVGAGARADVAALSAGAYHTLSLDRNGKVWASGWNRFGQLGDGTTTDRGSPVQVAGLTGVVAVSAGAFHSLAVKADGSVWAWGWNGFGQLGDGTTIERHTPVRVARLAGVAAVEVAAGAFHNLLLAADGTVRGWGFNGWGQVGDGTIEDRHAPVPVPGLAGVGAVATGAYHSLALRPDGSVLSWGWNRFGQLGDGTTVERHRPVAVIGLSGVAELANGSWFHSVAVDAEGTAWAWGWNGFGQLGDGTTVERHAPVKVAGHFRVVGVDGGGFHSLSVDASGTVRAWGWNVLGQLGDGTTVDRHVPAPVRRPAGTGTVAALISAGAYHSLAA